MDRCFWPRSRCFALTLAGYTAVVRALLELSGHYNFVQEKEAPQIFLLHLYLVTDILSLEAKPTGSFATRSPEKHARHRNRQLFL